MDDETLTDVESRALQRVTDWVALLDDGAPLKESLQTVVRVAGRAGHSAAIAASARVITTRVAGHVSTHYEDCWQYHVGCFAVLILDLAGEPRR